MLILSANVCESNNSSHTPEGETRMPKKKAFDAKKLIKMVKDEIPQPEIMKAFSFKTAAHVKSAYLRALIEFGEVPAIVGGRGGKMAVAQKTVKIGKRGSIIIPAEMVSDLGLGSEGVFTVRKTKAGVALKRVAE
jgi:hypothetical protein